MKQMAAFLVVLAVFILFVGSKFKPSDGDALAAISRLTVAKLKNALPSADRVSAPVNALRSELPEPLDGRVKSRLSSDKALDGLDFTVVADGSDVRLRGVVPDSTARRRAIELAESTTGVNHVIDELAVPAQ